MGFYILQDCHWGINQSFQAIEQGKLLSRLEGKGLNKGFEGFQDGFGNGGNNPPKTKGFIFLRLFDYLATLQLLLFCLNFF